MSLAAERSVAGDRIERFVRRFGETHRRLAWYAALPLVLTPELLDSLRLHFLSGPKSVPWIAEADLLLSDLCRPVGYEQYALDQPVRATLLTQMRAELGAEHLREAAWLLLDYVRHLGRSGAGLSVAQLQAEQWSAMAYLDEHRGQAAREIADAFAAGLTAATAAEAHGTGIPTADLARLVRITEELSPNLADHRELIEYAAEVAALLRNPGGLGDRLAGASAPTKEIAGVQVPALKVPTETTAARTKKGFEFELLDAQPFPPVIRVIGIGDAGCQVVNRMMENPIEGVDLICVDTSMQSLRQSKAKTQLLLGEKTLGGQDTGGVPEIGRRAAQEDRERIREAIEGSDMLFIVAGMGGGTGTGASAVVAKVAAELGILTMAIVSKPFVWEGEERMENATAGIRRLGWHVDSFIVMANEKILSVVSVDADYASGAFYLHEIAFDAVRGIAELITRPGLINVDFVDVKTVMSEMGSTMIGTGEASGENRARMAAEAAIISPLLEDIDLAGAKGILVNITAGMSLSIGEFDEVGYTVRDFADYDATVVVGTVIDPDLFDEFRVTVVATGLGERRSRATGKWTSSSSQRSGDQPVSPQVDDSLDLDWLDIPTFLRQQAEIKQGDQPASPSVSDSSDLKWLDIPTFLRRQADTEQPPKGIEKSGRINISRSSATEQDKIVDVSQASSVLKGLRLPLDLLDPPHKSGKGYTKEMLDELSRQVELKLADFGVAVEVVAVHPGPVVVLLELQLAPGTKVSKITGLSKDIARALSTVSVRVVEVIPGKSVIGLEIPNEHRETVFLSEVLASSAYQDAKAPLTLAMGTDISGQPVCADLARMPHALIAGTTGSGKSVAINAMILSLVYKSTPRDVRLIMVDPKMLELSVYEGIPHLLTPVVTDIKEAANALRWGVAEMERRYRLMAQLGVRNIAGYNRKVAAAEEAGEPIPDPLFVTEHGGLDVDAIEEVPHLGHLPYIVVIIDELADMMMVVGKKVEELIARLAQKARASGIHLLLATQRPSVDVLTGLIKANIPTRMAFQVSSRVDSRTILDQMGAEHLLGWGDMLYLPPGTSIPQRVHGAFVDDHEVHRVVEYLKQMGEPDYIDTVLQDAGEVIPSIDPEPRGGVEDEDPLFDEAVKIVTETRRASISGVQRRLKIGYNRAARMIKEMERIGIVGPQQSNGNREVLRESTDSISRIKEQEKSKDRNSNWEEPLILTIHITPETGVFSGDDIVLAVSKCGIEPGEMDIFYRYRDQDPPRNPLFCVANMVKPGTFPFGSMAEFESPGLTLFTRMEGGTDDPPRLEEMFETAYCLAKELDAKIRDESREPLTLDVEQRLRDRVREFVAYRLSKERK